MYSWADIGKVKKDLWNKLHSVKTQIKTGATNLAQIIGKHTNNAVSAVQRHFNNMMEDN